MGDQVLFISCPPPPQQQADETDLSQHPLYRAMERFLQRKALQPGAVLCVSLSGGVDSMVIAKLLCAIRDGGKLGAFEVLQGRCSAALVCVSGRSALRCFEQRDRNVLYLTCAVTLSSRCSQ